MAVHEVLRRLGDAVRTRRKGRGWTRRELARACGISERFLADVERGSGNPSLLKIAAIADALATTPDALLAARTPAPNGGKVPLVVLLGLRGAGKSSVGARLAETLGCPFVELDGEVERTVGLTLPELFEVHGEDYYRRAEREVLERLLARGTTCVVAAGGGIVTDPTSFGLLKRHAHTVWLRARPEDHWTRVIAQGDTRPMEGNERAFSHLCAILSEREKLYQTADVTVETSGREVGDVVEELAEVWGRSAADATRG